jgi:hypothetical protein
VHISTPVGLVVTVVFTSVCWILTALIGPKTDRATLISFYKHVRPFGPGWEVIRKEAGIAKTEKGSTGENIPMALLGWVAGCSVVWSSLFTVGNFLYGRTGYAVGLLAVFLVSGGVLLYVMNKLWGTGKDAAKKAVKV